MLSSRSEWVLKAIGYPVNGSIEGLDEWGSVDSDGELFVKLGQPISRDFLKGDIFFTIVNELIPAHPGAGPSLPHLPTITNSLPS